ncbi:oplophorus-luciferin 2-monooxygenase non-catalytic subunit-like [Limulus polyphemus]|uniref:Oplophorus-luciferin 2-monooxygenase non-catalytic subunit-like n=1 Tax=Limulus polyphemus TaxID=6850 RepID=A0ABM1BHI7_LIMPO|nr:oplophorus-luciferin 2-monooxygenase non-catalytic subunit-like [Limulus polyphemus]XP_013782110.1 oplophorus-luciferin 2-monooxygenase non-catalytic subunit-like [Limulus polyphemus]
MLQHMKMPRTHFVILAVLCFAVDINDSGKVGPSGPGVYPTSGCPPPVAMLPCVCGGFSIITCSNVTDEKQLVSVFQQNFTDKGVFGSFFMENTPIKTIPSKVFGPVVRFRELNMDNNSMLEIIEEDAFSGLEETANAIYLRNCNIKSANIFKAVSKLISLTVIHLNDNQLTSVPNHAFENQELKAVFLQNNRITSIGGRAFEELRSIVQVDLSNNLISEITDNAFHLNFESSDIPAFVLINNSISDLPLHAFGELKTPFILVLNRNRMTSLKQEIFEPLLQFFSQKNAGHLYVEENSFCCDYRMKWLVEQKSYFKYISHIICQDGRNLKDYTVDQLGDCSSL